MRDYYTFHTNNIMNRYVMENPSLEYSKYGVYEVDDELSLSFPNNTITITKKSQNQYLFCRKSGESEYKQRISTDSNLSVQIAPVLPLNLPEEKTSLLYLDFDEPLYLDKKVKTKITVPYPIEIGVFIHNEEKPELLDCFSCDDRLSRFALYGTPTEGHFCKYAFVDLDKKPDNLCYGRLDVAIKNNMNSSAKLGKIILNASAQDVFCSDKDSDVILESIKVELDEKNSSHATITVNNAPCQDHALSPRIPSKSSEPFAMTEGYD